MSYVPDLNAYGMLSDLGNKISAGVKEYQQKQLLSALGQDLLGGDYQSAAAKALQAGDMATGLKLMELGQQKQNAAALPSLLQGPSFGQQPANAAPTPSGDGSGGDYFGKLAQIESKGNPNAVSPTGAQGLFQFIPSTWKQYGGGADVRDPKAQFVAVQKLTADNRNALTQALGREPTAGELYLAHQQGAGGAIKLLSNPGATPAELGLGRNVAVNGGNPNAPAAQFVQKWVSKFDGVGSPLAFGSRDQATAPSAVAYARPATPAASEDDGEEDKPAAGAQVAQGTVPAVPTPAKSTKSDDGENAAKIAALRDYQSRLTMGLATATGENAKAAITARLQQVKDQLAELKPDKEKFQIIKNEDGSITAVNKTDPSQFQNIQIGKPKSQAEYDTRKVLADDMGLSGSARTTFLANGKIPDHVRVLRKGDKAIDGAGTVIAQNDDAGGTLSEAAINSIAERNIAGDENGMKNLGRGAQGAADIARIRNREAELKQQRGITPEQILDNIAKFGGEKAGARSAGQMAAKLDILSGTVAKAADYAQELSQTVPRAQLLQYNKLVQAGQRSFNDPKLAAFNAANNTLINEYARAVGGGVGTDASREHAREMLNTAQDQTTYAAVVKVLQREVALAHGAAKDRLSTGAGRAAEHGGATGGKNLADPLGIR